MSAETIKFLLGLLDLVSLSGADPDLVERAQQVAQARAELMAGLGPSSDG